MCAIWASFGFPAFCANAPLVERHMAAMAATRRMDMRGSLARPRSPGFMKLTSAWMRLGAGGSQLFRRIQGSSHVRFGSLADIGASLHNVRFTPKADIGTQSRNVRYVPKADILKRRGVIRWTIAMFTPCNG